MKAVPFKDQNMVFGPPPDMTDEQCDALPAKQHALHIGPGDDDVYPAIDSVWELDAEDMALIVRTGKIRLTIFGRGMPPVSLRVEDLGEGEAVIELSNGEKFTIMDESGPMPTSVELAEIIQMHPKNPNKKLILP